MMNTLSMATSTSTCYLASLGISQNYKLEPKRRPISSCTSIKACSIDSDSQTTSIRLSGLEPTRRQLAGSLALSILTSSALPSCGAEGQGPDFTTYFNTDNNYSLLIPGDWTKGTGKDTRQRDVVAFFPTDDASTNVNVVITGVGGDYTSLGSFGPVEAFAETLVNGLDRSWKRPPGQAAKLISAKAKNGFYYVEYTIQQPGEQKRHLVSVVGMKFNGWYNRLYTVTGQYFEENQEKYGQLLEKVIDSFKFV